MSFDGWQVAEDPDTSELEAGKVEMVTRTCRHSRSEGRMVCSHIFIDILAMPFCSHVTA